MRPPKKFFKNFTNFPTSPLDKSCYRHFTGRSWIHLALKQQNPSSINQISKGPVETLCSFRKDPSVIKDEICEYDWYHMCHWLDPFHDLLAQLSQVVPGTPHRPALKDRFHQIQVFDKLNQIERLWKILPGQVHQEVKVHRVVLSLCHLSW